MTCYVCNQSHLTVLVTVELRGASADRRVPTSTPTTVQLCLRCYRVGGYEDIQTSRRS